MQERLQKIISNAGITSRRKAEQMIIDGLVKVNGRIAMIGQTADVLKDIVTVNNKKIERQEKKYYIMLNKPRGYVTTMSDDKGRKDVTMLVNVSSRVYPVGRLDINSEGLLILTNDGELANKLMHPKHEVNKGYKVKVKGSLANIDLLEQPMDIDGYAISSCAVDVISITSEDSANIYMTIHEGRNRQIRKMCEKCSLDVMRLSRVSVGKIVLDKGLKTGKWRHLTQDEIEYLMSI